MVLGWRQGDLGQRWAGEGGLMLRVEERMTVVMVRLLEEVVVEEQRAMCGRGLRRKHSAQLVLLMMARVHLVLWVAGVQEPGAEVLVTGCRRICMDRTHRRRLALSRAVVLAAEAGSIERAVAEQMTAVVAEERVVSSQVEAGVVRLGSKTEGVVGARAVRFQERVVRELEMLGVEARVQRAFARKVVA